jgi:hypothetical protein
MAAARSVPSAEPLAARLRRSVLLAALVAVLVLLAGVANAGSASAAPARSASVTTNGDATGDLVVTGARRARRGDQFILYLARRCASTIRAARRGHYVIARGRVSRSGRDRFRAMIAESEVRPRRGRACFLLADSRGSTRVRASDAYRMR